MTFVPLASFGQKIVHARNGAVENGHGEAVVVHVENQILAHHGQTNQGDISLFHGVILALESFF